MPCRQLSIPSPTDSTGGDGGGGDDGTSGGDDGTSGGDDGTSGGGGGGSIVDTLTERPLLVAGVAGAVGLALSSRSRRE